MKKKATNLAALAGTLVLSFNVASANADCIQPIDARKAAEGIYSMEDNHKLNPDFVKNLNSENQLEIRESLADLLENERKKVERLFRRLFKSMEREGDVSRKAEQIKKYEAYNDLLDKVLNGDMNEAQAQIEVAKIALQREEDMLAPFNGKEDVDKVSPLCVTVPDEQKREPENEPKNEPSAPRSKPGGP